MLDSMGFKVMNKDFVKADKFDGANFARWKEKIMFLLAVLNMSYLFDLILQPLPHLQVTRIPLTSSNKKKNT